MRLRGKQCRLCGKPAIIRVSQSARNPNRLYFCCPEDGCQGWLGWCVDAENVRMGGGLREMRNEGGLAMEVEASREEWRKMVMEMASIKTDLGFLKNCIWMCLCVCLVILIVLVFVIGKIM